MLIKYKTISLSFTKKFSNNVKERLKMKLYKGYAASSEFFVRNTNANSTLTTKA